MHHEVIQYLEPAFQLLRVCALSTVVILDWDTCQYSWSTATEGISKKKMGCSGPQSGS